MGAGSYLIVAMCSLSSFFLWIFFKSPCLASKVEDSLEDTREPSQDDLHPFLTLPVEMILMVTSFLDREYQVLLSYSCRRLRVLLSSNLDLSLPDRIVRMGCLRYLELDYPEYITCRFCGFLFNWHARRFGSYRCLCGNRRSYTHADWSRLYPWFMPGDGRNKAVSREVVDLILRAHERGPEYGLPVSYLTTSGNDRHGVTQTNEARFVNGELLIASRWEAEVEPGQEMANLARHFNHALCLHLGRNVNRHQHGQYIEDAVTGMTGLEDLTMSKCLYCACDHILRVQGAPGGRMRIILSVWRNYGQRCETKKVNEQMFHQAPSSRTRPRVLFRRDLQAMFNSQGSDTGHVGSC